MLLIIILFSLQNIRASAQLSEILFHSEGKMQKSNFQICDSLKVYHKESFQGIIFNKLDSRFIVDTSLLYDELKQFTLKSNDSLEYYFFYNGTEKNIIIRELPLVKIAQTRRGELWPIMYLGVPSCGSAIRNEKKIKLASGKVYIFKLNTNQTKGNFKTLSKVRMKTNMGIISTRPFECSIDENSFYIKHDVQIENQFRMKTKTNIIDYRRAAFLEK